MPLLLLFQGCLFDPDAPCGEGQTFADGRCLCPEGTILNDAENGCRPCGENEFAAGTICVCAPGFFRRSDDGPCEPRSEELGRECDPGEPEACPDELFSHCHVPEEGPPYCTSQGCIKNDECGGGFGCNTQVSPSFCERYPSGLGQPCATDADCAGYEANYCETYRSKICLVQGCAGPEVTCYGGSLCCDWSSLGVPLSLCISPESLEDGQCPVNGTLVEE